jgi:hypothetical protein
VWKYNIFWTVDEFTDTRVDIDGVASQARANDTVIPYTLEDYSYITIKRSGVYTALDYYKFLFHR